MTKAIEQFTATSAYALNGEEAERDGFTFTASIEHDGDCGTPWDNSDGHGPVSEWERRAKLPGELVLCGDGRGGLGTDSARRFYDFQESCRIALRDGWGVSPYHIGYEQGANGLTRATAQWFEGRELVSFRSDWHDDINAAVHDVYRQHQATMSPRAYAAKAARADYEYLRGWCNDEWSYCGIIVTAYRDDIELGSASLWGIESNAGEYLRDVANELLEEALGQAREALESLCDCEEAAA